MNRTAYLDFVLGLLLQLFNQDTGQMSLITVTWDHAVNSNAELQSAIASDSKMMEADVITGHLIDESEGENIDRIPIMGHPPAITSDLSLKEFLNVWNRTNKILKLDFKSTEAFILALPIMADAFKDLPTSRLPWLNADILPGPGPGGSPGVNANTFLGASSRNFPDSILSLGWTTKRNDYGAAYTENYVNDMIDVLFQNKYMKPVTYAVRASFAVHSIRELQYLLETSPVGSTLTVWCSDANDDIDHQKLVRLINTVGADRIYLDLPGETSRIFFEKYATSGGGSRNGNAVLSFSSILLASVYALTNVISLFV